MVVPQVLRGEAHVCAGCENLCGCTCTRTMARLFVLHVASMLTAAVAARGIAVGGRGLQGVPGLRGPMSRGWGCYGRWWGVPWPVEWGCGWVLVTVGVEVAAGAQRRPGNTRLHPPPQIRVPSHLTHTHTPRCILDCPSQSTWHDPRC